MRPDIWLYRKLPLLSLGPVSRKSWKLFGLGKLFFVRCVCIQDQSLNSFENSTRKLSVNDAKWSVGRELCYYSTGFDFKIWFGPENLPDLSRNEPSGLFIFVSGFVGLINRGGGGLSSADQKTFWIFSLFQASIHRKLLNSFHFKLEGAYIWGCLIIGWLYFSFTGSWAYNPDGYIFEIISCGELCRNRSYSLAGESARLLPISSLHLDFFFFNRTSADEKFPVVVTELTFPSVAVESVPFAIQTGETVDCYVLPQQKLDSCS